MDPNQQPAQQPGEQSSQPKSHSLSKILLTLLCTVLVLGLIGGAYYLGVRQSGFLISYNKSVSPTEAQAPTPNSTVNWHIYKGNGFVFQYPPTWVIAGGNESTDSINMYDSQPIVNADKTQNPHAIGVHITPTAQNAKSYIDSVESTSSGPSSSGFNNLFLRKVIFLNGQQVESYAYLVGPSSNESLGWFIPFSNGREIINFGPLFTDPYHDSIELQVVKTFNFTE